MDDENWECGQAARRQVDAVESGAASISLLCLIHCLALPVFLSVLPAALNPFIQSEGFHWAMIGLLAPFAMGAFWMGYRHHGSGFPAWLGVVGIGCLTLAFAMPEAAHTPLTVTGSILLIAAHWKNWRLRANAA